MVNAKRCVIIPAFNEEKQLASVIEGVRKYSNVNIIVIDDGSRDMTAEIARQSSAYVIRHPFNMGAGAAVQTGYKYASENNYDYLLQLDGDGQHHPRYIPDLFAIVENHKCDIVFGSRFLKGKPYKLGFLKYTGIKIFRQIIRIITREIITDPTSGYRCMNRNVFEQFTEDFYPCDYPDANIVILLHRLGFIISELPVTMVPNPEGRSMHRGVFKITYYFFKVFLSILVILLRKKSAS
jgi:glycosyltransferase involved in cell wall biosynthesis